jgi:hypothetical protein
MSTNLVRWVGTGDNPQDRPANDFYSTPPLATQALLDNEKFKGPILEPACGEGAITQVLLNNEYEVISSDLHDYGYGNAPIDFLSYDSKKLSYPSIITNPPYKYAEQFLSKALELTKEREGKVALLLKLQFLEGQKRKVLLENSPLKTVYVFSRRLSFTRGGTTTGNQGMMAFAWFVWDWGYWGYPVVKWL